MIRHFFAIIILLFSLGSYAQKPTERPHCTYEKFDKKVAQVIGFTVPVIGVAELKEMEGQPLLLDARPKEEYDVSHIEGAKCIGFKDLNLNVLETIPKDQPIVLYCSIGYRSEKVGEQLLEMGYTNVYNLYGSIFEWVNQGNTIVDVNEEPTTEVHTYNKKWSKWVQKGKATKVW